MQISYQENTSSVSTVVGGGGIVAEGFLSPEAMMQYISERLGGMDEEIQGMFQKQKDMEALRKALGDVKNQLNTSAQTEDGKFKLDIDLQTLNETDPALGAKLEKELHTAAGDDDSNINGGIEHTITKEQKEAIEEIISQHMSDIEASAQLEMIRLQSLMSARQSAIGTCTNCMKSFSDSQNQVVNNYK
jgi:hypothetical protein